MLKDEKQQIAARLKDYCAQKGSQNKAANSMTGVSSATVSKVLAGDWDTISDDMWRTIASQVGHERKGWNIAPTQAYKRMTFLLTNAQRESLVLAVTGDAGCGKREEKKSHKELRRRRTACLPPVLLGVLEQAHIHGQAAPLHGHRLHGLHGVGHDG